MSSSSGRSSLPSYTRAPRPNQQAKRYNAGPDLAPEALPASHAAATAGAAHGGRRGVSATVTPTQPSLGAGKSPPYPRLPFTPPIIPRCKARAASQPQRQPTWQVLVGWSRHQLASQQDRQLERQKDSPDRPANRKDLASTGCHPGPEALPAHPPMHSRYVAAVQGSCLVKRSEANVNERTSETHTHTTPPHTRQGSAACDPD